MMLWANQLPQPHHRFFIPYRVCSAFTLSLNRLLSSLLSPLSMPLIFSSTNIFAYMRAVIERMEHQSVKESSLWCHWIYPRCENEFAPKVMHTLRRLYFHDVHHAPYVSKGINHLRVGISWMKTNTIMISPSEPCDHNQFHVSSYRRTWSRNVTSRDHRARLRALCLANRSDLLFQEDLEY